MGMLGADASAVSGWPLTATLIAWSTQPLRATPHTSEVPSPRNLTIYAGTPSLGRMPGSLQIPREAACSGRERRGALSNRQGGRRRPKVWVDLREQTERASTGAGPFPAQLIVAESWDTATGLPVRADS